MTDCFPLLAALVAALTSPLAAAEPARPGDAAALVITDAAGKEQKLKSWKFVAGTRRLGWLEPAAAEPGKDGKPRPPTGPEALVVREENSTDFENGILTLVPLDRVRSIEYDDDKQSVTVHVAAGARPADDVVLTGTTKFAGVNRLTIEAEVELGDLGVAEKKFLGGVHKGIRAVRFPAPKAPAAPAAGRPAAVTARDKDKSVHLMTDLQPLYLPPDGVERRLPTLTFKKTLKVDLARVGSLRFEEPGRTEVDCQVTLKGGEEHTLTLLRVAPLDGQMAPLEGFVGAVPAGYKLFPVHTVAEIRFDTGKDEKKEK